VALRGTTRAGPARWGTGISGLARHLWSSAQRAVSPRASPAGVRGVPTGLAGLRTLGLELGHSGGVTSYPSRKPAPPPRTAPWPHHCLAEPPHYPTPESPPCRITRFCPPFHHPAVEPIENGGPPLTTYPPARASARAPASTTARAGVRTAVRATARANTARVTSAHNRTLGTKALRSLALTFVLTVALTNCSDKPSDSSTGQPTPTRTTPTATPSPTINAEYKTILDRATKTGLTITGLPTEPEQLKIAMILIRFETALEYVQQPGKRDLVDVLATTNPGFGNYVANNILGWRKQGLYSSGPLQLTIGKIQISGPVAKINTCADYTGQEAYRLMEGKKVNVTYGKVQGYVTSFEKKSNTWKIKNRASDTTEGTCNA
jgi:hypothetical protein